MLADVKPTDEIFQEEVFGPGADLERVRRRRGRSRLPAPPRYGLAAMAYTCDQARANRAAETPVAGTVWVNCYFIRDLAAPFGVAGISGIGREGGRSCLDFFCDVKKVAIRRAQLWRARRVGEIVSAAVVGPRADRHAGAGGSTEAEPQRPGHPL